MEFISVVIYLSIYLGLFATTFYIWSFVVDTKKKREFLTDAELPKVSVIIPCYNEGDAVTKTLESITASNYPKGKLEIIFVDDGSTDDSLKFARGFKSKIVRVFAKKVNGGSKAAAFNYGFTKATGEIILSMDADTMVDPESIQRMVRYFKNKKVMAVTPSMIMSKVKGILERIQHVEYLMGLFLRKAFASLNAIYITPGAFTAYRKSFMDKYGVYEEGNITEDLEMALRIQSKGYIIENCPEAPVYTIPMNTFKTLLIQRRRWYFGLIQNLLKYKFMISKKYGDLGMFVIPIAVISVFFSLVVTGYLFIKTAFDVRGELLFLRNVNFDLPSIYRFNSYIFERFLHRVLSNPVLIFLVIFMGVLFAYLYYAQKKVGRRWDLLINVPLFFIFFATLFAIWWMVSIFYAVFFKSIKWR
ncbi:glycosyltransferase family 2 protein [archaeon]|jgi:cellulose synthase/poly-beta-1,6-N-acetylglucosamine synthase-like glycosyltransferase|nr:glycosyltransferase family 2 protein [archaeon]MBT4373637.1 glycosyltransferase family 2 protein [archaeon]MBT4531691.1 glycosyltransferase family 2 protein [archaeon]MBT7001803.1 glycosyltransferase family 2 protein [archaeon]MBT7281788.1 glycosyltransferase family 2 protein [archaeon]